MGENLRVRSLQTGSVSRRGVDQDQVPSQLEHDGCSGTFKVRSGNVSEDADQLIINVHQT